MLQNQEIPVLTSDLLNGRGNYIPWARSVTLALSGKQKLGFVTGTKERPKVADPNNPTQPEREKLEEWQSQDHLIMSWLLQSMEKSNTRMFMYLRSSKEVWDKAKTRYGSKQNYAHIYTLKQKLVNLKQKPNQSNNELITEIMAKWEELNCYLPPTEDPEEIEQCKELDLIFTYLGALDSSYEAVRSQIMISSETLTFEKVVSQINQEESMRALVNPSSSSDELENKAFFVKNKNPNQKKRGGARGYTENKRCDHCRKEGHVRSECWFLNPHLRPKHWTERGEGGGAERKGEHSQRRENRRESV